jgi:FkbM family methyltransferase
MQAIRSLFAAFNSIPGLFRGPLEPMRPPRPRPPRVFRVRLKQPTPHTLRRALHRMAGDTEMVVSGAFGDIVGSVADYAILERYARERTWCPVENAFFEAFFARHGGGTYLDIGANIGLTAIPVARNAGVRCLAFEPEPANFRYLRRNVVHNCGANVELFSLALFDRRGRLPLQLSPTNQGDHRVRVADDGPLGEAGWPVVQIDAERLDDVLAGRELRAPLAAKIVAQGAEAHIVAGGRRILARVQAMVVEIYPYALRRMQADMDVLLGFMAEHFTGAAIIDGGSAAQPIWRPVDVVVDAIKSCMAPGAAAPSAYFHVFLRK